MPDGHNESFRYDPFTGEGDRQELVRDILPEKLTKYSR